MAGVAAWQPHRPAADTLLVGLLLAPVVEEIVFRGGLQALLRERWLGGRAGVGPVSWANLVASLSFAALHVVLQHTALAAWMIAPALLLGWVYDRTERLAPVILLHAFYNALWLCLLV